MRKAARQEEHPMIVLRELDGDVLGPARRLTVRCEEHALLVRT